MGWVLVITWILGTFVFSLPGQFATFQRPSASSAELTPQAVLALRRLGVTLTMYAWTAVGLGSLIMLTATALALILFWRRSDDWMALLVSLLMPAYCFISIVPTAMFHTAPSGSPLSIANTILLATLPIGIVYAVFMLFPSGRFVPSWSWALLAVVVAWAAAFVVAPKATILYLGYPLFVGAAIASQVYRYRRVSTPVQRQQTRWGVFGLVSAVVANQVFWGTASFTPLKDTVFPPFAYLVLYGSVLLLPITFFIAIRRHRLYEIDTIINRALVYGTLTTTLVLIYFSVVLGVQAAAQRLVGASGRLSIVIVATTLLVAALFAPLRSRIQALIDRAFYRSKYNAAQTLSDFGAKLRMETDLEELRVHLLEATQQTMQPTHVTLWLRQRD